MPPERRPSRRSSVAGATVRALPRKNRRPARTPRPVNFGPLNHALSGSLFDFRDQRARIRRRRYLPRTADPLNTRLDFSQRPVPLRNVSPPEWTLVRGPLRLER